MIFPGKLPKSTRIPWSALSPWKSSSLTSRVCRKKGSSSLDAWMRSTWREGARSRRGSGKAAFERCCADPAAAPAVARARPHRDRTLRL